MATLESRLISLAQAVGADVKIINNAIGALSSLSTTQKGNLVSALNELNSNIGTLSGLSTTQKGSLVAAVNEVLGAVNAIDLTDLIDDTAGNGDANVTYSADKIVDLLDALKTEIMGGIPPSTLDTIKELADFLADNALAGGLVEQMGLRVRVDAAQSFNSTQQAQGRSNIGAAADADLTTLTTNIGNTDRDFAGDYATAKA
jgi:hypothetical protein